MAVHRAYLSLRFHISHFAGISWFLSATVMAQYLDALSIC
jgi:hypothetical protein